MFMTDEEAADFANTEMQLFLDHYGRVVLDAEQMTLRHIIHSSHVLSREEMKMAILAGFESAFEFDAMAGDE